jgi:Tfp pilus assembly protein PilF
LAIDCATGVFSLGGPGRLRRALAINTFDAYRWVDLALAYTIAGKLRKADRALKVAVSLAAEDRFVLRAATRFRLHQGNPEEALFLLKKAQRVRFDPWLLATYVATAEVARAISNGIQPAEPIRGQ